MKELRIISLEASIPTGPELLERLVILTEIFHQDDFQAKHKGIN